MLKTLKVHGFRTLVNTDITFSPMTVMVGKNGVGKTSLLDVIQIIGKFARGGCERAFGPPPWSLGWQRTKGIGTISTVDFEAEIATSTGNEYRYRLKLNERKGRPIVEEERLTRIGDGTALAFYDHHNRQASGSVLNPDSKGGEHYKEIREVGEFFEAFQSYELNPSAIERLNDSMMTYVRRDGLGVAAYLGNLKDKEPEKFDSLVERLKEFRPETKMINIYSTGGGDLAWGITDNHQQELIPAVHLSWGDRQLIGLLCVLYSTKEGSTIAIEEIDRGFHPSRFDQVIDLLTEAVFDGIFGTKFQIFITTHSTSFINKMRDREDDIRIATRTANGATIIKNLQEIVASKIGSLEEGELIGDIWESGLLESTVLDSMQ